MKCLRELQLFLLLSIHCITSECNNSQDLDDPLVNMSNPDPENPGIRVLQIQTHSNNSVTDFSSLDHNPTGQGHGHIQFLQDFLLRAFLGAEEPFEHAKSAERRAPTDLSDVFGANITSSGHYGSQCTLDLMMYSVGLQNRSMWALKMADATGRRGPGLFQGNLQLYGSYDQCMGVREVDTGDHSHTIDGNDCLAFITVPEDIIEMVAIPKLRIHMIVSDPMVYQWHLCVPKSCSGQNVTSLLKSLPLHDMTVFDVLCREDKDFSHDGTAIIGICVCCLFLLFAGVGTLYGIIVSNKASRKGCDENHTDDTENQDVYYGGIHRMQDQRSTDLKANKGVLHNLLLSFSLLKNIEKLLSTESKSTDLSCLHGIRVLSMAWIILCHTVYFMSATVVNPKDIFDSVNTFPMQAVISGSLAVDTFFLLSGCLVSFIFLRETETRGRLTCRQMTLYYAHRYWRLTPLYMMVIVMYVCLSGYFSDGPNDMLMSTDNCRRHWWINLLYINNVYKNTPSDICLEQSWFLSADMQFHWIAPLALIPLACGWVFIGFLVVAALLCVHIITYTALEYLVGGNASDHQSKVYFMPYCRVGVFAVGISLGYILYKAKGKTRIPKVLQLLGWTLAIGTGLTCTYATYNQWSDDRISRNRSALLAHEVLFRPAWALAVSWLIFTCYRGVGGFVNTILSWRVWMPLGRLTYGAFLLHVVVLTTNWSSSRTPMYYSTHTIIHNFLSTWIISYGLAFVFSVLVETPCMAVEKVIVKK